MTNNTSTSSEDSQGDNQNPQAQGAASTSQGDTSSTQVARSAEETAQLLEELKRDNAKYRKRFKEQEDAAQTAEQQRKAEQGQFKELAEQHEARVKELEPIAARFEAMSAKIKKQIALDTKEWPDEIKAFYPGDDADVDALQDWYDRSKPLLEKLQGQQQAAKPIAGNRPNPPALNNPAAADATKYTQNLLRTGKYGA